MILIKKFKYLTNYYLEFNSLNPNVIDEIVFNDISYNGNNKSTLILHGVGGKPILAKTKNQKILVDKLNKKTTCFCYWTCWYRKDLYRNSYCS